MVFTLGAVVEIRKPLANRDDFVVVPHQRADADQGVVRASVRHLNRYCITQDGPLGRRVITSKDDSN